MRTPADTPSPDAQPLSLYDLGRSAYLPVQALQADLRRAVAAGEIPGALLLLEHDPVITVGAHAHTDGLVDRSEAPSRGFTVVRSERGGQTTLHAPGQLICYPVMRIPRRDLRAYVHDLEEVLVITLAAFGLRADRIAGKPGLYVQRRKIASLGLKCERGITSHGSALNVSIDLSLFDLIISCGEPTLKQTSVLQETGQAPSMHEVKSEYVQAFKQVFGMTLAPATPD